MNWSLRNLNRLLLSSGHFIGLLTLNGFLLLNNLCINVSDECFQVSVHFGNHGEATLASRVDRLLLRLLVDFGDCAVNRGLSLANPLNVLLVFVHLGLFVLIALPSHLTQITMALVLSPRVAQFWFNTADLSLLAGVIAPQTSLLNSLFNLTSCEKLPLLEDLIGALLELLTQRARMLRYRLLSIRVHILFGDIELHPVDVERAGLCSVN